MTLLPITTIDDTGAATITAIGEVDMDTSLDLADAISTALGDPRVTQVVVDLSHVTFLDMVALGDLLRGRDAALETGRGLWVSEPRGIVRRVLEITGTYGLLTGSVLAGGTHAMAARALPIAVGY